MTRFSPTCDRDIAGVITPATLAYNGPIVIRTRTTIAYRNVFPHFSRVVSSRLSREIAASLYPYLLFFRYAMKNYYCSVTYSSILLILVEFTVM